MYYINIYRGRESVVGPSSFAAKSLPARTGCLCTAAFCTNILPLYGCDSIRILL